MFIIWLFLILGVTQNRKASACSILYIHSNYSIKHTLDHSWMMSGSPICFRGQATCYGWWWIDFPMFQTKTNDEWARTTYFKASWVAAIETTSKLLHAEYKPWNGKALNWHRYLLYEKACQTIKHQTIKNYPHPLPSQPASHVQCLGTANSHRLLWAMLPVLRQCKAPAYKHHPGSPRISSARVSLSAGHEGTTYPLGND